MTAKTKIIGSDPGPNQKDDPPVTALIRDIELNNSINFSVTFEGKTIWLINNTVHSLPKSVVEHLKNAGTSFKSYVPGRSKRVSGKRLRFAITILEDEAFEDNKELLV